ncbi:MAG: helicase-exonuclease AddAB subunit AddA [Eubacteriales bacterium]|nr:helicase-exonuclease AddAB subunit AddA [Eubacteriales bacterium]
MWTNEQQHAIDVRNKNILISAAAGSGKTAVLVERIITMIKNGEIRLDKLLITTFTVAAAGEIKERILKSLTDYLNDNPDNSYVAEQIALFDKATIGTIHSFCQSMLRNNFYNTPLPSDFRIADAATLEMIKEEMLTQVIEEEYEKGDEAFNEFADGYSTSKDDSSLRDMIKDLHRYSEATRNPIEWLESCIDRYDMKDMTPDEYLSQGWGQEYIKGIPPMLDANILAYNYLIDLAEETEGYESYAPFLAEEHANLTELLKIISNADSWSVISDAINSFTFPTMPRRAKGSLEDVSKIVGKNRNKLKDKIASYKKDIFYGTPEQICNDIQIAGKFAKVLCNLAINFERAYAEAKLKKGIVSFADLEHYTIRLLEEHGDLFRDRYDAIMIDEFQDTNEAQADIFRMLSNGENLFMVGDIKQSIYRFRNAQPQLFARMDNDYSHNPSNGETIYLAKNFRCSERVVDFVNLIFARIMNTWIGEVDYGEKESLIRGGAGENEGYVEVNIIGKKFADDKDISDSALMTNDLTREAMLAAKHIYNLVEKEKALIYDKRLNTMRPVEYSDITVLARGKNAVKIFAEEIGALGIPVYCQEAGSFSNTIEITFILSLLRVIDNPLQDVELLGILRSPVFGFDDDDLVALRSLDKNKSIYHLLKVSDEPKAISAIKRIDGYIKDGQFMTPTQIISMILADTEYESIVSTMPNSTGRLMNLQLLRERADSFEADGYGTLSEFLNYIMAKANVKEDTVASVASINDNTVRVMTIHKSKGLEFPVVFLVNTGREFNLKDISKTILYDIDSGLGLDIIDSERRLKYSNLSRLALSQKKLIDLLSEEMRVLYVALTRPISRLYIYGSILNPDTSFDNWDNIPTENGKVLPYTVLSGRTFIEWIMEGCYHQRKNIPIKYWAAEEAFSQVEEDIIITGFEDLPDTSFAVSHVDSLLDYRFGYTYPYLGSTTLPSKLSVSQLLSRREHRTELIDADFSKDTASALSGAQRGDLIHFILQNISLDKTNTLDEINEQIDIMRQKGQISESAYESADPMVIYNFFSSPNGIRLKSAFEVHREYQFVAQFDANELIETTARESILLQGIIDCWFEEDGKIVIYDYKTGNVDSHSERYTAQLDLYKKSLEKVLGKQVKECVICKLDN